MFNISIPKLTYYVTITDGTLTLITHKYFGSLFITPSLTRVEKYNTTDYIILILFNLKEPLNS